MSGASGELNDPVDEVAFTPRLFPGPAFESRMFRLRDPSISEDRIVVTDENAIRVVDDTIEAADNVIRATEIVKQTLGKGAELAGNDFGESRTARDGAKTGSSLRLLLAAGEGILAAGVVLGLILIGIQPISKVEQDHQASGSMADVGNVPSPPSGIISGANMASHVGDEVPRDVQVGVLSQEVTNKDARLVNSANAKTNPPQKVANDAAVRLKPAQIAELIERGSEFVGTGDLNSARLLFERAAEARDPKAAFALAATYDPILLEQLGIHRPAADVRMARAWYQKAEKLGSPSASWRLELLASRGQ